jgi:alkyl hydroperoxide reductase subunit AhpC
MTKIDQQNLIEDWENELSRNQQLKIKFPIVVSNDDSLEVNLDFNEPKIKKPEQKKIIKNSNEIKVLDLSKKRGVKNKPKLF